jgi:hypothetical protein
MINPTRTTINACIEKWTPVALDVEEASFSVPIRVLAGDALDLAHFVEHYWEPQVLAKRPIPGLKQAATTGMLRKEIAAELLELQLAMSDQFARDHALASNKLEAPVERGELVLSELRQTLAFLFDDGITDENDEKLARTEQAHANPTSHDALALALEAFAHLAEEQRDRMVGLPEFDVGVIDEALVLARRLREQSALKLTQDAMDAQRAAVSLRNRFATLLIERVGIVRSAARYVFRNHPTIARKASSSYERTRRARARQRLRSATNEVSLESAEGTAETA